ncbi:hypothetical protein [Nonomuraea sp. B19D2]|uniref:hypothetical protein n=1 Tax=Nonomuraea sp. B19D2 TaxID=3159561 RepID=UPI0032DA8A27
MANALQRIQQLEEENTTLNGRITALCAVISELTHEAQGHNIVMLPAHRTRL